MKEAKATYKTKKERKKLRQWPTNSQMTKLYLNGVFKGASCFLSSLYLPPHFNLT
jgi:hypothetical protein